MAKTARSGSRNLGLELVLVAGWSSPTSVSAAAGPVTRVSLATDGTQANGDSSPPPSVSADGRYVAFSSAATNLVSGDINGAEDVFVRDRAASQTTLVSKTSDGLQGNNLSYKPAISADGRYVAFVTFASNFGATPLDAGTVYVHDRQTGATTLVSKASDGTPGVGDDLVSPLAHVVLNAVTLPDRRDGCDRFFGRRARRHLRGQPRPQYPLDERLG